MSFAELNPEASPDQLSQFVTLYNSALMNAVPGDSKLVRDEHMIQALQFTQVNDIAFAGLDTRAGTHAMSFLSITIPNPDGFESIQRRMVRYESSLSRPIITTETKSLIYSCRDSTDKIQVALHIQDLPMHLMIFC